MTNQKGMAPSSPVHFEDTGNAVRLTASAASDDLIGLERLREQLQTVTPELAEYLARLIATCQPEPVSGDLNGVLAAIGELKPKDPLETLLILQMFLTSRRAGLAIKYSYKNLMPHEQERQIAIAIRLMRLYTQQMEALRKYRNGSNQTINVNYVHADQAVVTQGG